VSQSPSVPKVTSTAAGRPMDADEQKRASAIARGLLAGWDVRTCAPLVGTKKRKFNQQQLLLAHGLCAHVHYLAPAALDLLDSGRVLAALPLVRACFESAITAQWLAQTTDGSPAFVNEDVRQRLAQVHTLEQAVSDVFREAAPSIAANLPPILDTTATARGFHKICDDLVPGGADAYTIYRVLSQYSHASIRVVDGYLQVVGTEPGVALRTNPAEPSAATWTNVLASCLVWAGRSNDYLDGHKTRRSELRAAANALGINSELHLSPTALLREASASKQAKPVAKEGLSKAKQGSATP